MADITRKQRVYFGGAYKEEWSPNYTLKIKYTICGGKPVYEDI